MEFSPPAGSAGAVAAGAAGAWAGAELDPGAACATPALAGLAAHGAGVEPRVVVIVEAELCAPQLPGTSDMLMSCPSFSFFKLVVFTGAGLAPVCRVSTANRFVKRCCCFTLWLVGLATVFKFALAKRGLDPEELELFMGSFAARGAAADS